ncbi:MAG: hypothetical protein ABL900_13875 [Burkholderiaceae bacterium]
MKTYAIELQKVKAMGNDRGVIKARIDALVQAQSAPRGNAEEAGETLSVLSMSEDTARVLLLLLKAQLAEFDKRKARSRF